MFTTVGHLHTEYEHAQTFYFRVLSHHVRLQSFIWTDKIWMTKFVYDYLMLCNDDHSTKLALFYVRLTYIYFFLIYLLYIFIFLSFYHYYRILNIYCIIVTEMTLLNKVFHFIYMTIYTLKYSPILPVFIIVSNSRIPNNKP
jgi:hypothetical protein